MNDKFMMDGHKLYWHLDRVAEWNRGERIAPLHIDLGITTGCNMACSYCYGVIQGRTGRRRRFDMPLDALVKLLDDAKDVGVRSIAFIGEGENTLNPALYDGLKHAKSIGLDVSIATNGIDIDFVRIDDFLSSLVWLRFNISASNPDSFFRIHRVRMFERVIHNISACVKRRNMRGLPVTIGMQMVVVRDNINDIVPLAKLGRQLGIDYLVVKACSDTGDKTLDAPVEVYLELESLLKEAELCSTENYTVSIKWQKLQNLGLKDFKQCFGTQFIIAISGDGTVYPCGHFFNIRRDEFFMGNVIKKPFREIIASERYWEVQKLIQSIDVNCDCESNCRQYYINRFLDMLNNRPPHINFI